MRFIPVAFLFRDVGGAARRRSVRWPSQKPNHLPADFDRVWTAAVEVAKEGFLPDRIGKEQGKLGFRTRPFYGYRRDVGVEDLGRTKTRIVVELRRIYPRKFDGADAKRCRDRHGVKTHPCCREARVEVRATSNSAQGTILPEAAVRPQSWND